MPPNCFGSCGVVLLLTVHLFLLSVVEIATQPLNNSRDVEGVPNKKCFLHCLKPFAEHSIEELFCNSRNLNRQRKCSRRCFTNPEDEVENSNEAWQLICIESPQGSPLRTMEVKKLIEAIADNGGRWTFLFK